jgi:hypothetical protein
VLIDELGSIAPVLVSTLTIHIPNVGRAITNAWNVHRAQAIAFPALEID